MQNHKVWVTAGLLMMLAALTANRSLARWTWPQPKPVAIETFPTTIGAWQGGENRPMSSDVQKVLSTARSVDRPYTNKATGQTVQLLLLTGAHSADFHTPKVCFPSQGWATGNERTIPFSGQMINVMDAEREGTKVSVWFWWYRNDPVAEMKLPDVPLVRDVYRFRLKIAGESASTSLFVRLIAPAGPAGDHAVKSLMNDIWAPIERLAATGGVRIVPGAVQPADGKQ